MKAFSRYEARTGANPISAGYHVSRKMKTAAIFMTAVSLKYTVLPGITRPASR